MDRQRLPGVGSEISGTDLRALPAGWGQSFGEWLVKRMDDAAWKEWIVRGGGVSAWKNYNAFKPDPRDYILSAAQLGENGFDTLPAPGEALPDGFIRLPKSGRGKAQLLAIDCEMCQVQGAGVHGLVCLVWGGKDRLNQSGEGLPERL